MTTVQGAAMANFAYNELGVRKAATVHDGSPYAEQLQQVFADTFVGAWRRDHHPGSRQCR